MKVYELKKIFKRQRPSLSRSNSSDATRRNPLVRTLTDKGSKLKSRWQSEIGANSSDSSDEEVSGPPPQKRYRRSTSISGDQRANNDVSNGAKLESQQADSQMGLSDLNVARHFEDEAGSQTSSRNPELSNTLLSGSSRKRGYSDMATTTQRSNHNQPGVCFNLLGAREPSTQTSTKQSSMQLDVCVPANNDITYCRSPAKQSVVSRENSALFLNDVTFEPSVTAESEAPRTQQTKPSLHLLSPTIRFGGLSSTPVNPEANNDISNVATVESRPADSQMEKSQMEQSEEVLNTARHFEDEAGSQSSIRNPELRNKSRLDLCVPANNDITYCRSPAKQSVVTRKNSIVILNDVMLIENQKPSVTAESEAPRTQQTKPSLHLLSPTIRFGGLSSTPVNPESLWHESSPCGSAILSPISDAQLGSPTRLVSQLHEAHRVPLRSGPGTSQQSTAALDHKRRPMALQSSQSSTRPNLTSEKEEERPKKRTCSDKSSTKKESKIPKLKSVRSNKQPVAEESMSGRRHKSKSGSLSKLRSTGQALVTSADTKPSKSVRPPKSTSATRPRRSSPSYSKVNQTSTEEFSHCFDEPGSLMQPATTVPIIIETRPTSSDEDERPVSPVLPSTVPVNLWKCPECWIRNIPLAQKCVACGTTKPSSNKTGFAVTAPLVKKQDRQWKCDDCCVSNESDVHKRVACGASKPGSNKNVVNADPPAPLDNVFLAIGPSKELTPQPLNFPKDSNTNFKFGMDPVQQQLSIAKKRIQDEKADKTDNSLFLLPRAAPSCAASASGPVPAPAASQDPGPAPQPPPLHTLAQNAPPAFSAQSPPFCGLPQAQNYNNIQNQGGFGFGGNITNQTCVFGATPTAFGSGAASQPFGASVGQTAVFGTSSGPQHATFTNFGGSSTGQAVFVGNNVIQPTLFSTGGSQAAPFAAPFSQPTQQPAAPGPMFNISGLRAGPAPSGGFNFGA